MKEKLDLGNIFFTTDDKGEISQVIWGDASGFMQQKASKQAQNRPLHEIPSYKPLLEGVYGDQGELLGVNWLDAKGKWHEAMHANTLKSLLARNPAQERNKELEKHPITITFDQDNNIKEVKKSRYNAYQHGSALKTVKRAKTFLKGGLKDLMKLHVQPIEKDPDGKTVHLSAADAQNFLAQESQKGVFHQKLADYLIANGIIHPPSPIHDRLGQERPIFSAQAQRGPSIDKQQGQSRNFER